MKINKQLVAREWIFFSSLLFVGLIIVFFLCKNGENFIEILLSERVKFIAWLVALAPYILIQFLRSIWWSIKMIRA